MEEDNLPSIPNSPINVGAKKKRRKKNGRIKYVPLQDDLKCTICWDKPTGYHYGALACTGCKSFFRRTVAERRKFVCIKGGKCLKSKDFRCVCRSCRFKKCLQMGMDPLLLKLTEQSIEREDTFADYISFISKPLKVQEIDEMKPLHDIVYRETAHKELRYSREFLAEIPDVSLEEAFKRACSLGAVKSTKTATIPCLAYLENPTRFWGISDLFQTVEFAKTFPEFLTFSPGEKISFFFFLLKIPFHFQAELISSASPILVLLTQSFYSLHQQSESTIYPDGINALYYHLVVRNRRNHEHFLRQTFCRPIYLIKNLRLTFTEFAMLKTIALFSSDKRNRALLQQKKELLVSVFRKYLVMEYGLTGGLEKLANCLFALNGMINEAEKVRDYLYVVFLTNERVFPELVRNIYLNK